jgi:glycosyltransferase involved in cell wall biosynthesis
MNELSIVIPCYNESKRILNTLDATINWCNSNKVVNKYEIIIVDDGSTDNTMNVIADKYKNSNIDLTIVPNIQNRGKGFSIRRGIVCYAKYEYILFMDADLSTSIDMINRLDLFLKHDTDIIIGSRNVKGANILSPQSFSRRLLGRICRYYTKILCQLPYQDTQCGFKFFKAKCAKHIFGLSTIDRFSFDIEILMIAKTYNYKIIEMPVDWKNDNDSKVKSIKDPIEMLWQITKLGLLGDLRWKKIK